MTPNIEEKNMIRIDKMKKIGVATAVAVVGLGIPALMTPSAMAYQDTMHSLTTMDMAYTQTSTGYSISINAKDLSTIESSGINLEAYINEEFYVMIDEVIVDMSALYSNYGTSEFNINIDRTDNGFNYSLTTEVNGNQVAIEQMEGSSFVGQVTKDYMDTDSNTKLYHSNTEIQQMNYDGDIFVVFEAQGEYSVNPVEKGAEQMATVFEEVQEDNDIIEIKPSDVANASDTIKVASSSETITLFDSSTKEIGKESKNLTQGRDEDIIVVDSNELVNKLDEGKTNTDLKIDAVARKEKQDTLSKKTENQKAVKTSKETAQNTAKNTAVVKVASVNNIFSETKTPVFEDIEGIYSEDAIVSLTQQGIMEVEGKLFKPNNAISREQFAVVIANSIGLQSDNAVVFSDMQGSPYGGKIQALYEAGIFIGDNGEFKPTDTLSRQQASAVLVRTMQYKGYDTSSLAFTPKFKDKDSIALYAKESVAILQELGVVSGKTDGTFNPYGQLTNAQIAKMVYNVLELIG